MLPRYHLVGRRSTPCPECLHPRRSARFVAAPLEKDHRRGADHPPGSRCALEDLIEILHDLLLKQLRDSHTNKVCHWPVTHSARWAEQVQEARLGAASSPDTSLHKYRSDNLHRKSTGQELTDLSHRPEFDDTYE